MIGGGGEKKTLRLVAQYADACNVFGSPEAIARKYAILAAHCAAVGRDPDEIERSTLQNIRPGPTARAARRRQRRSSTASASWPTPAPSTSSSRSMALADPGPLELVGRDVIPPPARTVTRYSREYPLRDTMRAI